MYANLVVTGSLTLTWHVTAGPGQGINIGGANVGQVTINGNITGGSSGTAHGINVTNGYGNTITVNGDLMVVLDLASVPLTLLPHSAG